MRLSYVVAFATLLTVGVDFPAASETPQVCLGHDEGFEVFTDCYGMTLTGNALRDAQIREMVQMRRTPSEIASTLGVRITTLSPGNQVCPPGLTHIPDLSGTESSQPGAVHCAH